MTCQEIIKPVKKDITSIMVDKETHHIIKLLAVQKRMKITDFIRQTFSQTAKQGI